jgi:hypothetical protein
MSCSLRVLVKRVRRRLFEVPKEKVAGYRRKMCSEDLPYWYSSPVTGRVIKCGIIKWAEHVWWM